LRDTSVPSIHLKRPILNKWTFLILGNSDRHTIFLSETNSILMGKQWSRDSTFWCGLFSLDRYMSFFISPQ
jgi:hypothetical protein